MDCNFILAIILFAKGILMVCKYRLSSDFSTAKVEEFSNPNSAEEVYRITGLRKIYITIPLRGTGAKRRHVISSAGVRCAVRRTAVRLYKRREMAKKNER
jgi:hypothetical protein